MSLLDLVRAAFGERGKYAFEARHCIEVALTEGPNTGPVTRVTGAGPTIEAAIDNAAGKLERGKA